MISQHVLKALTTNDSMVGSEPVRPPKYRPDTHYIEVSRSKYYQHLIVLRDSIKKLCDGYMSEVAGAKNIDLFMLTPSVSSPMGPGSDSEAIPITFGKHTSYLTDSSQFGFEPIMMNGISRAYCYLPSLRGESPDKRHLNQFYHCEIELVGTLDSALTIGEEFVKYLCDGMIASKNIIDSMSSDPATSLRIAKKVVRQESFEKITFDEACKLLESKGHGNLIRTTPEGRDISSSGELKLMQILGTDIPIWLTHFDRDRVPFYQKPDPQNNAKVLNADLLFPPIIKGSFGGEILGLGQRQDNPKEMRESLDRQGLDAKPYEWYINLRSNKRYKISSGFGLGIERYIAWVLGYDNIQDMILYPRLKDILTTP